MTRREVLSLAALQALRPAPSHAQAEFPGVRYREYWRCLPDFLSSVAAQSYELRNAEIRKLTDAKSIARRQQWVRETFWTLVGGRPERTPLHVRQQGSFEREGYRVEKLLYDSRIDFHVAANLYVPLKFQPPFPGVLFQMGHTRNGKAGEDYQRCAQALARLGYLVLAFDPMGQGERVYYPVAGQVYTRLANPDAEHTTPGRQLLLTGDTCTRLQVWDAVRSLDYLAAHPLVDPQRIASLGHSGGATLTMLLAAADDRLAAAAVCMGNTENVACAHFIAPGATDYAEQNLIGGARVGFDRWDLLYPQAPKPLWIGVSDVDAYGTHSPNYISSGWEEFEKLRAVYRVLGHPDQLSWYSTQLPHGLSFDCRMQIYSFLARSLKHDPPLVEKEPPVTPEADATLSVAESGNVVRTFGGETPFTLNRSHPSGHQPAPLAELLSTDRPPNGVRPAFLGRAMTSRGIAVELIEFTSSDHVWLPAWLYRSSSSDSTRPLVIVLEPVGRNAHWRENDLYHQLALTGSVVCVPDLRGIGDLKPAVSAGFPSYARQHQEEEDYAWGSLILGKPLLGQRVTDILAVVSGLRAS